MTDGKSPAAANTQAIIQELARGAEKVFENAEQFYQEALILGGAGHLSRALFLHQISTEECAKVETLGACAASHMLGHPTDLKKLTAFFRSHEKKNRSNAYFLPASEEEKSARRAADIKAARAAFEKIGEQFHQESNTAKNSALYVDFDGNRFTAPVEVVNETKVAEFKDQNEKFLSIAYNSLKLLQRCEKSPEEKNEQMANIEKLLKALKHEFPNDPEKAMNVLFDEICMMAQEVARSLPKDAPAGENGKKATPADGGSSEKRGKTVG